MSVWEELGAHTAARIGLARAGGSVATGPLLAFRLAHARARDAVHAVLDGGLVPHGVAVRSQAGDRRAYLMRPDLGRVLDADGERMLRALPGRPFDLVMALGDGLSAGALHAHAPGLLEALLPRLAGWRLSPTVLVHGARVAVGDGVCRAVGAGAVLVLLGERPGLSAPESLGAYLTWAPGAGTTDADRNCVSNIRPTGLGYAEAAHRIAFLLGRMRVRGGSGVGLKDESSGKVLVDGPGQPPR